MSTNDNDKLKPAKEIQVDLNNEKNEKYPLKRSTRFKKVYTESQKSARKSEKNRRIYTPTITEQKIKTKLHLKVDKKQTNIKSYFDQKEKKVNLEIGKNVEKSHKKYATSKKTDKTKNEPPNLGTMAMTNYFLTDSNRKTEALKEEKQEGKEILQEEKVNIETSELGHKYVKNLTASYCKEDEVRKEVENKRTEGK